MCNFRGKKWVDGGKSLYIIVLGFKNRRNMLKNSGFGLKISVKIGKITVAVSGEFTCILIILL
jgi:hypothetical protein